MADKPGVLRNLRIKRVAIVDSGANFDTKTGDGAHIMLFKSDGPGVAAVHVPTAGSEEDEYETDYEKANLDAGARNALPDSAFAAVWTDAQGKKHRKLPIHDAGHLAAARGRISQAQIPADVKARAQRRIDRKSKKEKGIVKLQKLFKKVLDAVTIPDEAARQQAIAKLQAKVEKTGVVNDDDEDDYPVHKSDDPMCKCADCMAKRTEKRYVDLEKSNSELKAEVEKARTTLAAEIEKRENAEMVEILKGFKYAPFDLDKDVAVFRKMKRDDPAMFERTMAVYKAQEVQLQDAALYSDYGTRKGGGEGSAWAQIVAKADQLMEKSKKEMTQEQAIEKVMLMPENNKLVKQYRQEAQ